MLTSVWRLRVAPAVSVGFDPEVDLHEVEVGEVGHLVASIVSLLLLSASIARFIAKWIGDE